jgi:hypothetical protein
MKNQNNNKIVKLKQTLFANETNYKNEVSKYLEEIKINE